MSIIYLFRHGITEGNKQHLYYGSTDLPIIDEGIAAIRKRREQGLYPNTDGFEVLTTDLRRTEQTLYEMYGTEVEHRVEPRMRELNFGDFEMLSYEELKDREDYKAWIMGDNWRNVCPNGESGEIMLSRSLDAMNDYVGKDCIIVCHGGVIAGLMLTWFPGDEDAEHFYAWQPNPCEGYKITFDNNLKPISYKKIKL